MASPVRTTSDAFTAASLHAVKGDSTVAVCLPARNESATVGTIVEILRRDLMRDVALVDEVVVVDDHSTDDTATVATTAGARVIRAADVPGHEGPGKGAALWKSLHETDADVVIWVDADLDHFGAHFVIGLLGPLLSNPSIQFTKGAYHRPLVDGDGGGRVTELLARPAIANLLPHLGAFTQPLSGEYGGRRSLLERLPFVTGYGVDLALLHDVATTVGVEAMAEVDLGVRHHRNRPLDELGPMATEVLRAALSRAEFPVGHDDVSLVRPRRDPVRISHRELDPLVDAPSYGRRSA